MKDYSKPYIEEEVIEIEDIIADSPAGIKNIDSPDLEDPFELLNN